MLHNQLNAKNTTQWIDRGIVLSLWVLLFGVFLFNLFNIFVYLFVPVDGATVWVRQGPVRVLSAAFADQDTAGLQEEDVILQIQGQDLDWWLAQSWQTLPGLIQRINQPSPTTQMTIQRNTETVALTVPLKRRPGGAAGRLLFTHLLVGYAFLIAGVVILKESKGAAVERIAVLIMALMSLIEQNEIVLVFGAEWAWSVLWLFIPLRLLTRWFAYSYILHFSLLFPRPKAWLQQRPYLPPIIHSLNPIVTLWVMVNVEGNLQVRHAMAYSPSKKIYIFFLLLTCLFLAHSYVTAQDIVSKNQMRWIAWGGIMSAVPSLLLSDLTYVLLGYKLLPTELSSLLLLFIPLSFAVAILRYRLWDIDLIIKASLLYGGLTVLLGMVYLALVSLLIAILGTSTIGGSQTGDNIAPFFLSALGVAALFTPARNYLQRAIDRIFFRNRLNYPRLMTNLSQALSTSLLFDQLLKLLTETIPEELNLRRGQVLFNAAPPKSSEEYQRLKQGRSVRLYDPGRDVPVRPAPLDGMQQAGLWICVPLLSGEEMLGLYGLGAKKSGGFYSREDIDLLKMLARQAGVALQNARLHEQLAGQVRIQRDLEIASQIQVSLLPSQDPAVSGLEIVSFSRPAQEVGGDFYHYVEFDDERIGIAVGDVSGKGIPAALFMAVSISTLRAQARHYRHNTAALLTAMNNILYPQMTISSVNAAMLYATVEQHSSGGAMFSVSNAGLIWPILHRSGQKIDYIYASGLPMGAVPDAPYREFHHKLLPGDLVILSSDGIVEAMNNRREIFGFDRLEQSVAACGENISAQAALEQLKEDIFAFVGDAELHDDMTIIAIRVV